MFRTYAFAVRAAYLSAVVLAPLFMALSLVDISRMRSPRIGAWLWFLLFTAILCLPSLRAWIRFMRHGELLPAAWIRSHGILAALVAFMCVLALWAVVAYVHARWFIPPWMLQGIEESLTAGPAWSLLLLYSIALPLCELSLAWAKDPRRLPVNGV